MLERKE